MTQVDITLPEPLLAGPRQAPHELAPETRVAAAIHWYQHGLIAMERAAEAAGMGRAAFLSEVTLRRVDAFSVDEQALAQAIRNA